MEPDPFEPPDPPPPLTPETPPAGAVVNILSVLVAPFVVVWDALRYFDRVAIPAIGRALRQALELFARIAGALAHAVTAIVESVATVLRLVVNVVVKVMDAIGPAWSLLLAPFVRVFVVLVGLLQRGFMAVVRLLRMITSVLSRVVAIGAEAVHHLVRIVERVVTALASAIRSVIDPVIQLVGRALISSVAVVRSARAQVGALIRLLVGPVVAAVKRAGLGLRRITTGSGRVLRAAVAVARRFLWWLVRPFVVPARAAFRAVVRRTRVLTARVRIRRAAITASVRDTLRSARARVRRR
ncbi:MAG: hypothetical protein ABIP21_01465 [Acidimicrobiia bacterium]